MRIRPIGSGETLDFPIRKGTLQRPAPVVNAFHRAGAVVIGSQTIGRRAQESQLELLSYHSSKVRAIRQAENLTDMLGYFVKLTENDEEEKALLLSCSYTITKGYYGYNSQTYPWLLTVSLTCEVEG